jgi:hypothetical protein
MNPRLVTPVALLAGSCVTARPPSAEFFARAEQIPGPQQLLLPPSVRGLATWQLPSDDPWARYSKWTLLAALGEDAVPGQLPDVRALNIVRRAEQAGLLVGSAGLASDTLWLVDLRGAASVAFGNAVSHAAAQPVSLVLTFNNWPAQRELIPAEETLAALVTLRPRLPEAGISGSRPMFLLDAWRLAFRDSEPDEDVVDNRYYLNPSDLPDADTLFRQGIRQVIYVTETLGSESAPITEEDDLNEPFLRYAQAGLQVATLGLDDLLGERPPPSSVRVLSSGGPGPRYFRYSRIYVPRHRPTLITSHGFYSRAHGGFGGPRARPRFHGIYHQAAPGSRGHGSIGRSGGGRGGFGG